MSNYTLTSPVDVTSAGAGQIQLYDASGTNSVTLAAPTLTSNVTFPLPSNSGVNGYYLYGTGLSSSWISNTYGQTIGTTLPISMRFSVDSPATGFTLTSTPILVGYFMYPGSTVCVPSYATITYRRIFETANPALPRIQIDDVTNSNNVLTYLYTSSTITGSRYGSLISELLTFSNLPLGAAVFSITLYSSDENIRVVSLFLS